MTHPRCPACRVELTFAHAMRMPNPWRYECPECNEALDAGRGHKIASLALLPGFAGLVAAAARLQRLEVLNTAASMTFLAACAVSLLAGAVWLWRETTFTRKRPRR